MKKEERVSSQSSIEDNAPPSFPIVGVGASAGGLTALNQFFEQVPVETDMAFVVIQHMDPTKKGMLVELLQKKTLLPVELITDQQEVEPGRIYVIPPNNDLSILNNTLCLHQPQAQRGLRLPIDYFLRSLAEERGSQAIGVILSGMGSDGTLGLQAIKEQAGLVMVQDPANAEFDSMPRSAISEGLADIISPAAELPRHLIDFVQRNKSLILNESASEVVKQKTALDMITSLLRKHTGQDFSLYKNATIYRRIERRMHLHHMNDISAYVTYLQENPKELDLLFKELLIGVTRFFRDTETWAILKQQGLIPLVKKARGDQEFRAWVVGCSTGEEAYSLAIAFREVLDELQPKGNLTLQIFATDLDQSAIERARQGWFTTNIAADVTTARLERFFNEEAGGYRLRKSIREMVVFAPQNLIMEPPFTRVDILTCRNLLIYLEAELQKKLLPLFHYSLKPDGVLLLGSAETAVNFSNLFTVLSAEHRLYQSTDSPLSVTDLDLPFHRHSYRQDQKDLPDQVSTVSLQSLVEQLLLRNFSPAALLVNAEGDILYINGRTGNFLEPATGKANMNIHAMARDGLRQSLDVALPRARNEQDVINLRGINLDINGDHRRVDIAVHPLLKPDKLHGLLLIVFKEVFNNVSQTGVTNPDGRDEIEALHQALTYAHEETRSTREVMQSAQEELRSSNEELQSTNEELTTSKEELQSLNEELQTVNAELQSKVDQLSAANNDMMNLLNSTDIATIFLDNSLKIRRFTTHATNLFKLIPGDLGRPLSDIASALYQPELENVAREVLRTLVFSERLIPTQDNRYFIVKILPYRTSDNVIDGVVMTFTDISSLKQLEQKLRRKEKSR